MHPRYSLIVAANRDEFHARPTLAAGFCQKSPWLLMGRDQQAGGTWLGFHQSGRFAAITNMPGARTSDLSRGDLPLNYLTGDETPLEYAGLIQPAHYRGFNLLLGSPEGLCYLNNADARACIKPQMLKSGLYGLANRTLNSDCAKLQKGRARLTSLIDNQSITVADLLAVMAKEALCADASVTPNQPRGADACFTTGEDYGTRATTVILVDKDGHVQFTEQTWFSGGVRGPLNHFRCFLQ